VTAWTTSTKILSVIIEDYVQDLPTFFKLVNLLLVYLKQDLATSKKLPNHQHLYFIFIYLCFGRCKIRYDYKKRRNLGGMSSLKSWDLPTFCKLVNLLLGYLKQDLATSKKLPNHQHLYIILIYLSFGRCKIRYDYKKRRNLGGMSSLKNWDLPTFCKLVNLQ